MLRRCAVPNPDSNSDADAGWQRNSDTDSNCHSGSGFGRYYQPTTGINFYFIDRHVSVDRRQRNELHPGFK